MATRSERRFRIGVDICGTFTAAIEDEAERCGHADGGLSNLGRLAVPPLSWPGSIPAVRPPPALKRGLLVTPGNAEEGRLLAAPGATPVYIAMTTARTLLSRWLNLEK